MFLTAQFILKNYLRKSKFRKRKTSKKILACYFSMIIFNAVYKFLKPIRAFEDTKICPASSNAAQTCRECIAFMRYPTNRSSRSLFETSAPMMDAKRRKLAWFKSSKADNDTRDWCSWWCIRVVRRSTGIDPAVATWSWAAADPEAPRKRAWAVHRALRRPFAPVPKISRRTHDAREKKDKCPSDVIAT